MNDIKVITYEKKDFKRKDVYSLKPGRGVRYLGVINEDLLYIFHIKRKQKGKINIDREDFFVRRITQKEKDLIDNKEMSFIQILDIIISKEAANNIVFQRVESKFLKESGIYMDIIPVYENYKKKDDNLEYFLLTFREAISVDKHHPLKQQLEDALVKLLTLKIRKALDEGDFKGIKNIIKDNRELVDANKKLRFLEGLSYYNYGEISHSEKILESLYCEDPDNGEYAMLLSRLLDEMGKIEKAIEIISSQIQKPGESVDIYVLEYFRLLLKSEKIELMQKKVEEYKKYFEGKEDTYSYYRYYKGICLMMSGQVEKALEEFQGIRGSVVDDVYLRMNILQIYKIIGEKDKFLREKESLYSEYKVDESLKDRIESWEEEFLRQADTIKVNGKGKSEVREEIPSDIKRAIDDAKRFVEENPKNAWGYYSLGSLLLKVNETNKAEENFIKSLEILPDNGIVLHGLGIINTRRNNFEKAVDYFKKALISRPDKEVQKIYSQWNYDACLAYFSLADAYIKMKKIDEAILVLKKGIEHDASAFMPHFQLGTCYEFKKEYFKALECYMNVKKLNPEFYLVDFYIANSYLALKDYKNSKEFLESYLDNDNELIYREYALDMLKRIKNELNDK